HRPSVFLFRGAPGPAHAGPAWEAEQWLNANCERQSERMMVPDPASSLKERFFPELGDLPWRIRIMEFSCGGEK
ncbi:MAG: hypothetical protein ACRD5L_07585, partial [Bryobacteraceae bacterium]